MLIIESGHCRIRGDQQHFVRRDELKVREMCLKHLSIGAYLPIKLVIRTACTGTVEDLKDKIDRQKMKKYEKVLCP